MNFYGRYLELCNEKGTKPFGQEMADVSGISRSALSRWNKLREPSAETLIKLSSFFDVSIEYLLGVTDVRSFNLTDDEKQLLEDFRSVDTKGRHQIIAACDRIREESEARAVLQDAQ